jgi:hypothetical protein
MLTNLTNGQVAKCNEMLSIKHKGGTNRYVLGNSVVPKCIPDPTKPGMVRFTAVDRTTNEVVSRTNKADTRGPTNTWITPVLELSKSFLAIESSISHGGDMGISQSVSVKRPDTDMLASSAPGFEDIVGSIDSLIQAWYDANYAPKGVLEKAYQESEAAYKKACLTLLLDPQSSPYGFATEDEDTNYVVTFRTKFAVEREYNGKKGAGTSAKVMAILGACPDDSATAAMVREGKDDQRFQLVELFDTNGVEVAPDNYFDFAQTHVGAGALVSVEYMQAFGGVTQFKGTKQSAKLILKKIHLVQSSEGAEGGGSAPPINFMSALQQFETDAAAAAEVSKPHKGTKRKGGKGPASGKKAAKVEDSDSD